MKGTMCPTPEPIAAARPQHDENGNQDENHQQSCNGVSDVLLARSAQIVGSTLCLDLATQSTNVFKRTAMLGALHVNQHLHAFPFGNGCLKVTLLLELLGALLGGANLLVAH